MMLAMIIDHDGHDTGDDGDDGEYGDVDGVCGLRFVEYPEDTTWMEANLFDGDSSEHR